MLRDHQLEAGDRLFHWLAAAGAVGVIAGAIGPWATAWGVAEISGTSMRGWPEVALGVVALVLLELHRWREGILVPALATLTGALCAAGAGATFAEINTHDTLTILGFRYTYVEPAWGLYLAMGGALVLCGGAAALVWRAAAYRSGSTSKTVLEADDGRARVGDHH